MIMSVVSTHNAGFFSCCSVKLDNIVSFINENKKLPEKVDSSQQFQWYKVNTHNDITYHYFKEYPKELDEVTFPIEYTHNDQFNLYSTIDYSGLTPLIHRYFSPSDTVVSYITRLEQKYIQDYENLCVLFYRGNDKNTETKICNYEEYVVYAEKVRQQNPQIRFLIQSDETQFIHFFLTRFPDSIWFKDEVRHIPRCNSTVDFLMRDNLDYFSKYYLAITILMSKCKYIVCGTGNCSIWILLYRGSCEGVFQNLDGIWYEL